MDKLKASIISIEVGSTITKTNAFAVKNEHLQHIAQGFAFTTVKEGDVSIGLENSLKNMLTKSNINIDNAEFFINSSAAGGLKMTVHGLTMSMTSRAAKEASLGAGGIIKKITAGKITNFDLDDIDDIKPNLILIAGGIDYGDADIVLFNVENLMKIKNNIPYIYAGNIAIRKHVLKLAEQYNKEIWIADNVFPSVDVLNVSPLRLLIQEAFSKHIIHASGMEKISTYSNYPIIPTPASVLNFTKIFTTKYGDTLTIDVGGATTDIHSVTNGSLELQHKLIEIEPYEKRTVEGDLGVFINAQNIINLSGLNNININEILSIPITNEQKNISQQLCQVAIMHALKRHAGIKIDTFTSSGKKQVIKGKDLTAIQWIIATGGILTQLNGGEKMLQNICVNNSEYLWPRENTKILIDKNYLCSALGTISVKKENLVVNSLHNLFLEVK